MELASETKFCVNCIHYWTEKAKNNSHLCDVQSSKELNIVTGEYMIHNLIPCDKARGDLTICGVKALNFKAKNVD